MAYLSGGVGRVLAGEAPKEVVGAATGDGRTRNVSKQVAVRGGYVLPLHTTTLAGSSEHPKSPPRRRLRHAPSLLSNTGCRASSRRA